MMLGLWSSDRESSISRTFSLARVDPLRRSRMPCALSRLPLTTRKRGLSGMNSSATRNSVAGRSSTQNIQRQASKPNIHSFRAEPAACWIM